MRAKQISELLSKTIAARMPVLITGAPGIGKSDVVAQASAETGADLMVSHPVVSDPTDAKGLPWAEKGATEATFLPFGDLARAINATKPLVWFLDDLGQAAPAVQASFMQLLLARAINGHALPECVTFVAATNRRVDRAGVSGILEPVKSRFATIVELEANVEDWCAWANTHSVRPEVVAFIRLRPELLHVHAPSADMKNSPSPRTWAAVSRLLDLDLPSTVEFLVYAGAVGDGAAAEFAGFVKMFRELPSVDEVLIDPKGAVVPKDSSALYAISTAVGAMASAQNFDRVLTYAERLPQEYGVLCIRDAQKRNKAITKSKAWIDYVTGPIGKAVVGDGAL